MSSPESLARGPVSSALSPMHDSLPGTIVSIVRIERDDRIRAKNHWPPVWPETDTRRPPCDYGPFTRSTLIPKVWWRFGESRCSPARFFEDVQRGIGRTRSCTGFARVRPRVPRSTLTLPPFMQKRVPAAMRSIVPNLVGSRGTEKYPLQMDSYSMNGSGCSASCACAVRRSIGAIATFGSPTRILRSGYRGGPCRNGNACGSMENSR